MRRALEVARGRRHEEQAGRALANTYTHALRGPAATPRRRRSTSRRSATATSTTSRTFGICLRGERSASWRGAGAGTRRWRWRRRCCGRRASPGQPAQGAVRAGARSGPGAASGGVWPLPGRGDRARPTDWASRSGWCRPGWPGSRRTGWRGPTTGARRAGPAADGACGADGSQRGWVGDLAPAAGLPARSAPGRSIEPFATESPATAPRRPRLWADLGCPYEAALALLDSGDEERAARGAGAARPASAPGRRAAGPAGDARAGLAIDPGRARASTRATRAG